MPSIISIAKTNYKQARANSHVTDFWTLYFCRVLASILVAILRKTSITPNQLTYLSLVVHIIGIIFLAKMHYIIAPLLIMFGQVLDAADGQLAIIKNMKTMYGFYLDLIVDSLKELISYSVLLWLFIGSGYEIMGIISLLLVSFSLILDWTNRHIIGLIKPENKSISSNRSFRKLFGIQFWTYPIRNFIIVLSSLARNPQWILIYSVTVGLYLTGKKYYSVLNKTQIDNK